MDGGMEEGREGETVSFTSVQIMGVFPYRSIFEFLGLGACHISNTSKLQWYRL